jgi:hypothetical protein
VRGVGEFDISTSRFFYYDKIRVPTKNYDSDVKAKDDTLSFFVPLFVIKMTIIAVRPRIP